MIPGLRQIPVKVYRHTDPEAPVLNGTKGSLKTVLKACLITGFGNNPALGWEMLFEDDHHAAFRSTEETSDKDILTVDHSVATHAARIRACVAMSDFDTREDEYGKQNNDMTDLTALAYSNKPTPWILIGHEKAFVLLMENTYNNIFGSYLYFGDVPSLISGSMSNTVLWRFSCHSSAQFNSANLFHIFSSATFRRNVSGSLPEAGTEFYTATAKPNQYMLNHIGTYSSDTSMQLLAAPVYLREGAVFRALLSGIMVPSLLLPAGISDCPFADFEDYVMARVSEYYTSNSILVNKIAWWGM